MMAKEVLEYGKSEEYMTRFFFRSYSEAPNGCEGMCIDNIFDGFGPADNKRMKIAKEWGGWIALDVAVLVFVPLTCHRHNENTLDWQCHI